MNTAASDPIPPKGVDLDHPSVARVYDYYLGGTANWAIDREFGDRVLSRFPLLRNIAIANRMYLNRVVRHLTKLGVRQFLDIGSGVPTVGNTHDIADDIAPDSRVVYVDHEPVAVAHSQMILEEDGDPGRHAVIQADLREPDQLWEATAETGILNLDEPIALLMVAVLHVAQPGPDGTDIGAEAVARYRELLPSGSYLAISHLTDVDIPDDLVPRMADLKKMYDTSTNPVIWRTPAEIDALMGDFELLDPGMTWTPSWHPEETGDGVPTIDFTSPNEAAIWAGVARKP